MASLLVLTLLSAFMLTTFVSAYYSSEVSDYLRSQPFDPAVAEALKGLLDKADALDEKFMLELTRRIDFYFYVSDRIDELMDLYRSSLLPLLYQRDLYSGNAVYGTPSILRSAPVLVLLNGFIQLMPPFYALAILLTALYLFFASSSPSGRAKAKSTLMKLVFGVVLISFTVPIMEALLEVSHLFTTAVISLPDDASIGKPVDVSMFMAAKEMFMKYFLRVTLFDVLMSLPFLIGFIMLPVGVLLVLSIRYLMVIFLTVCFPFTVLLYSFSSTRKIGRNLLSQMVLWIFLPVLEAVILVAGWTAYCSVPYVGGITPELLSDVSALVATSCFLLLIFAPLIGLWLIRWSESTEFITVLLAHASSVISLGEDEGRVDDGREEGVEGKSGGENE